MIYTLHYNNPKLQILSTYSITLQLTMSISDSTSSIHVIENAAAPVLLQLSSLNEAIMKRITERKMSSELVSVHKDNATMKNTKLGGRYGIGRLLRKGIDNGGYLHSEEVDYVCEPINKCIESASEYHPNTTLEYLVDVQIYTKEYPYDNETTLQHELLKQFALQQKDTKVVAVHIILDCFVPDQYVLLDVVSPNATENVQE